MVPVVLAAHGGQGLVFSQQRERVLSWGPNFWEISLVNTVLKGGWTIPNLPMESSGFPSYPNFLWDFFNDTVDGSELRLTPCKYWHIYSQDFSHQQYHIHKFTIVERILEVAFIYSPKILTIDQKAPTHLTPNQNSLPFLHLSAEISVPKKPGVGIEH